MRDNGKVDLSEINSKYAYTGVHFKTMATKRRRKKKPGLTNFTSDQISFPCFACVIQVFILFLEIINVDFVD